jgi:hypothetical protein
MGMANPSSSPSDVAAQLDQFAVDYQHNPIQHVILNPFKSSILLLRAKYATYETITTTLNEKGVKVSEATVRKFCRTHQQEVKRLRTETDRKRRETGVSGATSPAAAETVESSPARDTTRPPLTVETGKPGPKIARERL